MENNTEVEVVIHQEVKKPTFELAFPEPQEKIKHQEKLDELINFVSKELNDGKLLPIKEVMDEISCYAVEVKGIRITGVDDKINYERNEKGRKFFKKLRVHFASVAKVLLEPYKDAVLKIGVVQKQLENNCSEIEDQAALKTGAINLQIQEIAKKKAEEEAAEKLRLKNVQDYQIQTLIDLGMRLVDATLAVQESKFDETLISQTKIFNDLQELKRLEEAEAERLRLAEVERIELERAESERLRLIEVENLRIATAEAERLANIQRIRQSEILQLVLLGCSQSDAEIWIDSGLFQEGINHQTKINEQNRLKEIETQAKLAKLKELEDAERERLEVKSNPVETFLNGFDEKTNEQKNASSSLDFVQSFRPAELFQAELQTSNEIYLGLDFAVSESSQGVEVEVELDINYFIGLVKRMRIAQRNYLKAIKGTAEKQTFSIESKELEKEVDTFLEI